MLVRDFAVRKIKVQLAVDCFQDFIVTDAIGTDPFQMVGARGFEPPTPTSRTLQTVWLPSFYGIAGAKLTGVSRISQRNRPFRLVHAHSRNTRHTTFRHLSGDPGFYFRFNPRYGMCGDFYAPGSGTGRPSATRRAWSCQVQFDR